MAAQKKPNSGSKPLELTPEEAFTKVEAELEGMNPENFAKSKVDAAAVGSLVLTKLPQAITPARRARLEALPRKEFDPSTIDAASLYARALQYIAVRRANAEAITTEALVPMEVVQSATTLKREMIRVIEYNLDDPEAQREVADIVSGQGYLDLAQDLRRLADVYTRFAPQLQVDKKRYRAQDAKRAADLADQIAPTKGGPDVAKWMRLGGAAWTRLEATYRDVRTTVLWLHRNDGAAPDLPVLLSALVTKSEKPAEAPPSPQ